MRNVANNFLRRDGSNDVEGEMNMTNHKLVGLSEPNEAQDATTRGYIKIFTRNNFLKLDGTNNMEGDINVNNHNIIYVANPSDDRDVINKRYLESTTNDLSRIGASNSMEGDINLNNNKKTLLITIWTQETGPLYNGQ